MEKTHERNATTLENTDFLESSKNVEGSLLGTNAKSATPLSKKTVKKTASKARQENRVIGYEALFCLRKWSIKDAKEKHKDINKVRTAKCMYISHGDVGVMRSIEHGSSHYKGLVTCGSVWACPICAPKIQERRRTEIEQAVQWSQKSGLSAVMVTFTFPHKVTDKLSDILDKQSCALRKMRTGGPWRRFKEATGYKYLIRSLEVTHSPRNGWHPHTHELWFIDGSPSDFVSMKERLTELWASACKKVGLLSDDPKKISAFYEHSVDIKVADDVVGAYLAKQDDSRKWGISDELAKSNTKIGRLSGVHPHQFLIRQEKGDEKLFIEYMNSMKGKRQIYWSKGLKDLIGINDVSDEELAEREDDPSVVLGLLSHEQWCLIRKENARAQVLNEAEKGGWIAVVNFVNSLRKIPEDPDELDDDQKYLYGLID